MGLNKSYLSKRENGVKQYNADMVTVVSEASLNSQLRSYLAQCNWKTTVYFLKTIDDNGNVVIFMLDENTEESSIPEIFELGQEAEKLKQKGSSVYKELEQMDLFSLAPGTQSIKNEAVDRAMSYSLGFAMRLEDGIPDEIMGYLVRNREKINPDDFLKIVTINPQNGTVLFRQFFKNIEIIQLNPQVSRNKVVGVLSLNRQNCAGDHPVDGLWSTTCSIAVDLKEISHKDILDEEVRKRIESMSVVPDPDTVFDISQLLLDLSTMQTAGSVTIEGIGPEVRGAINYLSAEYFNRLEKAGQTVFGHIILPRPNLSIKYLFTPNIRNFAVTDKAFYYLVNFKDDKAPVIPDFGNHKDVEWKPMLDNSVTADGAMTINATKFIPILRSKFEPVLQNLAITRHPYIKAGAYCFDVEWEGGMDQAEQKLCVDVDKPWMATWNYRHQYDQEWQCVWVPPLPFPMASGKIGSDYQASCETQFGTVIVDGVTYPSYDFIIRIKAWLNFGYNSGGNSGWYYDKTLRFQVGIKVDADGNFNLIGNTVITDNRPSGIDISGWGEFCSFGTLKGIVNSLTEYLNSVIERMSKTSVNRFVEGVNTFTGWFLPGCRTFTYKNEGISEYGDFYTYVNYVQE